MLALFGKKEPLKQLMLFKGFEESSFYLTQVVINDQSKVELQLFDLIDDYNRFSHSSIILINNF